MTTWLLIANRAGACVFKKGRHGERLERIMTIPHLEGRAHDRDLGTDKPGRAFTLGSPARSGIDPGTLPHEHLADAFATRLAAMMEDGRTHHAFDKLVLVAEPRFLGKLKGAMSTQTSNLIIGTLGKDLAGITDEELPDHLSELADLVGPFETKMRSTG